MRLSEPRVPPLDPGSLTDEQREIAIKASPPDSDLLNITKKTLVRHPKLLKRWNVFAGHVLVKSSLPPREARDRDPAGRVALPGAEYEWAQHVVIGRQCGLDDEAIERIKAGPDAPGWTAHESAILRATDELHEDSFIGDETWAALAAAWSEEQLMDFIFAVGQYRLVSMALNTLGVQIDPGLRGF